MDELNATVITAAAAKEVAKDGYADLLHSGAKALGDAVAGPVKLLTMPLALAGYAADLLHEKGCLYLEKKLKGIPPEHQITPDPSIAVPAIQGLACAINKPPLSDTFMNLIANAMTDTVAPTIHSSFPHILSQMSDEDALFFHEIFLSKGKTKVASVMLIEKSAPSRSHITSGHLAFSDRCNDFEKISFAITNLSRLSLINLNYDMFLISSDGYEKFEQHPFFQDAVAKFSGTYDIGLYKGVIKLTPFGQRFAQVVLREPRLNTAIHVEASSPEKT